MMKARNYGLEAGGLVGLDGQGVEAVDVLSTWLLPCLISALGPVTQLCSIVPYRLLVADYVHS